LAMTIAMQPPPALTSQLPGTAPVTSQMPGTPYVFVAGFALLAFVLAFYALIARERRTPYITTNTVYWTAVLVLSAVLFGGLGASIERFFPRTSATIGLAANGLLLIAVIHVI